MQREESAAHGVLGLWEAEAADGPPRGTKISTKIMGDFTLKFL